MYFQINNSDYLDNIVYDLKNKAKYPYDLIINEIEEPKTLNQLRYFWSVMNILAAYFRGEGYRNCTSEDVCIMLYDEHGLFQKKQLPNGRLADYPVKTLSKMTKQEASDFISFSLFWIDEYTNCIIPPDLRNCWLLHVTEKDLEDSQKEFPERDKTYLAYRGKQSCLRCGRHGRTQVAHIRLNHYAGMAEKPPDWFAISLCDECHIGIDHTKGHTDLISELPLYGFETETFCRLDYSRFLKKRY